MADSTLTRADEDTMTDTETVPDAVEHVEAAAAAYDKAHP